MFESRLSAAPISWGVCEVPGWGRQLPADRILTEMRSLGLAATELGAPGFLPASAGGVNAVLARYEMRLVGGFVPLVLHERSAHEASLKTAEAIAQLFAACGADRLVTATVMDDDWSQRVRMDDEQLAALVDGLAAVDEVCARYGLVQVLHPHFGTVVETAEDVERVLAVSDVRWCLDTGHLAIGGYDPLRFAADAADRVEHVHLKDVDLAIAGQVSRREFSLLEAVQRGLFRPFGAGDVAVDEIVLSLERSGYAGRYVLEQDIAITGAEPAAGTGPVEDVSTCLEYLRERVVARLTY